MPIPSYSINGKVYDRDGATVLENTIVIVLDVTTGERTSVKTNSVGEFILDLNNLASGYSNGDKLQITATYKSDGSIRSLSRRHTVDMGIGFVDLGNMVLHSGEEPLNTCHIVFASHTNSTGAGLYVDFYDRTNDVLIFRIEAPTGDSRQFSIGYLGKKMEGGFIRVFESEASGSSEALVISK